MKKVLVVFLLVLFGVCLIAPKGKVSKPKQSATQKKTEKITDPYYRLQAPFAKTKWEWLGDFVPNLDNYCIWVGDVEIDPKDPNHFLATCEDDTAIYESFDSGKTWQLKLRICNIDPKKIKIEIPKKIPPGYSVYRNEEYLRETWGTSEATTAQVFARPDGYGGYVKKLVWKNGYFYFASRADKGACLYRTKDWENFEVVFATMFYLPTWCNRGQENYSPCWYIPDFLVTDDGTIYALTEFIIPIEISGRGQDHIYELWKIKEGETKVIWRAERYFFGETGYAFEKILFVDDELKIRDRVSPFDTPDEAGGFKYPSYSSWRLNRLYRPKDMVWLGIWRWFDGKEIRGYPWDDESQKVLEKWIERTSVSKDKPDDFFSIKRYGKVFIVAGILGDCFITKDGESWKKAYVKEAKPLPKWGLKEPVLIFKDNWGYLFIDGRVYRIDLEKLLREDF
jgi:hypothetical protein